LDSFWALCFRYLDGSETPALLRKGKIDYRDVLSEAEFVVFAKLRSLRKEISEREGLPPYALFTNEQLAAMVRQQIRTKVIRHDILKSLLARRLKGGRILALLSDLIDAHKDSPGRGLPIGALTSQHFANFYLAGLDRYLLEGLSVRGMVRYMDDVVWWCDDRQHAEASLHLATSFLANRLGLQVKPSHRIAASSDGMRFCGFHVFPQTIHLSARRRHRYARARRRILAITAHADSRGFRRQQLRRVPTRISC
jgi:hypothetical protein